MAIAALLTRSLTQYRAGRRPLPSGTGPAARPAASAALAWAFGPRGFALAIGCADAALFASRMVNDEPRRPATSSLSVSPPAIRKTKRLLLGHAAGPIAARIHFENRP
jgi:hypothetical protein